MLAGTAPIGLYGWIRSNDGRSTGLFLAFLLAIQLIAPLALVGPLIVIDVTHAPFFAWGGYLARYAPLVLVASVAYFAAQLWWHVESVKRAVDFHFVDAGDEPRLCRLIEPLILLAGLPAPFVGVIESDARNAFACGIGRRGAVVVVTRGLIDALDDHELRCVLAHELAHIRNGDIRLMAAVNIFMGAITRLHARNGLRFTWVHALLTFAIPAVLPISLAGSIIARWALKGGQVSRLLIASSREFVADAEAVQWTQNPAAFASALLKVDDHYRIAHARTEDDAMMIAGDSAGAGATHPTVAQRIAALSRTTGSMVFNAPGAPRADGWSARTSPDAVAHARLDRGARARQAIARVRRGDGDNILGLDRFGSWALLASLIGLAIIHASELDDPRAIAAKFSLAPISTMVGTPVACQLGALFPGWRDECVAVRGDGAYRAFEGQRHTLAGYLADTSRARRERGVADPDVTLASLGPERTLSAYTGQSGRLRGVTATRDEFGLFEEGGVSSSALPSRLALAELRQLGCFSHQRFRRAADGTRPLMRDHAGDPDTVPALLAAADDAALDAAVPSRRGAVEYVERRKDLLATAFDRFGASGLATVAAQFDTPEHGAVLARFPQEGLAGHETSPLETAELRALLDDPRAFVPCASLAR